MDKMLNDILDDICNIRDIIDNIKDQMATKDDIEILKKELFYVKVEISELNDFVDDKLDKLKSKIDKNNRILNSIIDSIINYNKCKHHNESIEPTLIGYDNWDEPYYRYYR